MVSKDVMSRMHADLERLKHVGADLVLVNHLTQPLPSLIHVFDPLSISRLFKVEETGSKWTIEVLRKTLGAMELTLLDEVDVVSLVEALSIDELVLVHLVLDHAVAQTAQVSVRELSEDLVVLEEVDLVLKELVLDLLQREFVVLLAQESKVGILVSNHLQLGLSPLVRDQRELSKALKWLVDLDDLQYLD